MDYRKPWTIVHGFNQISFRTHNSSLEGATELKFTLKRSSFHALSDGILFAEVKFFRFWLKTMDYSPWFQSDFSPHS